MVVVDAFGTRTISAEWDIYNHELTPDGQFILALGDDAKRGAIWESRTGRRLFDFTGDVDRRQSLRAGLASIQEELLVFVAARNKDVSIRLVNTGIERGWMSTTGLAWFHVLQIVPLDGRWLAVLGHHGDDQYNTVTVIPALESLHDPMVLYSALTDQPNAREWGYRVAVGPAGLGQAVIFRDPEWDDEEPPDDLFESFKGLIIWDLENKKVVQRIEYNDELKDGAIIGADTERVAIEADGYINLVSRVTGAVSRVEASALDPYRLEIARIQDNMIEIVTL
jgi:hypothetical protein